MNQDELQMNNELPKNEAVSPPNDELEKCKKERDEYLSGWQRAKADFVNYKKEEARRLEEVARYSAENMIRELVTFLDHFDLAIKALEKQGPVEKGIYLIKTQLEDLLKKKGVEKIEISPGEAYDPALAEAIAETESDYPPGSIVEEIERGYRLQGKVLRPARVRISK